MVVLVLGFPAGRYHATPWGQHVNEGEVEWPPSPWRLLRALVAVGHATLGWREVPPVGRALVDALASVLPAYRLPRATLAHSRHYMPLGTLDKQRFVEKTTLVLDTWARVGEGEIGVAWDVALPAEEHALLARLAANLGYLGRSESWVAGRLLAAGEPLPGGVDATPQAADDGPRRGWERVPLLAPQTPQAYASWREGAVASALAGLPPLPARGKPAAKLLRQRAQAEEPYPSDLVSCLCAETAWLKAHGWSQPPGARRVFYDRPADLLAAGAPLPAAPREREERVEAVLLALATSSPGGSRSALPPVTRTLPQAELIHRALVGRVCTAGEADRALELLGRTEVGRPAVGHRHAHVLPLDLDGDGHLDHVLVWAPDGLGAPTQRALRALRETWTKGGAGALRVALAASGRLDDLVRMRDPYGPALAAVVGAGGAACWESCTPFVLPRHLKRRGANALAGQVVAELASRDLPAAEVEVLSAEEAFDRRFRHYVRARAHGGAPPPADRWAALRLRFEQPVRGPLCLGYASHFGLGRFEAARGGA